MPTPDNPTQEPRAGELFDAEESSAIIRAMSTMPYAGLGRVPIPPARDAGGRNRHNVTGEEVVAFLEGLADVLNQHAAAADRAHRDLVALRSDVAAARRLFGTVTE